MSALTITASEVDVESRKGGVPQAALPGAGKEGVSITVFRERGGVVVDDESRSRICVRACDGFEAWEQERDGVWFEVQSDYSLKVVEGWSEPSRAIHPLVPNKVYHRLLDAIDVAVAAYKTREKSHLPLGQVYGVAK